MTLASEIITDAYRQSNLLPISVAPTAAQMSEGLRYLNRIVKSSLGNEAGEPFTPIPIGRMNIQRPSGWPWYENFPDADWFIPENSRLMCNLTASGDVYLHPTPDDGARLSVIDIGQNFATLPLTIKGNGRRIDGVTDLVLNTDGLNQEWFYRADLGEWKTVSPLLETDPFPFPLDFDFFFITMLAMVLNPAYGVAMDGQTQATYSRSKTQFRARYHNTIPTRSELALLRTPQTTQDRWLWGSDFDYGYDPDSVFKTGTPW